MKTKGIASSQLYYMFLCFLAVCISFLKKNAYLCRQNEAETLFHRVLYSTICCFSGSCNELAEARFCVWARPCTATWVICDDTSAATNQRGYADRRYSIVSHLLVASTAHPTYAGVTKLANFNACLQPREAAYCQTPPFILRQQMSVGVGSVLSVCLVRLLRYRTEAHHSLA